MAFSVSVSFFFRSLACKARFVLTVLRTVPCGLANRLYVTLSIEL